MDTAIALKTFELLAAKHEVELDAILAEFANKDIWRTNVVMQCVAEAAQSVDHDVVVPEYGLTRAHMERVKRDAKEKGKVFAIRTIRDLAKRVEEERLGREVTYSVIVLKEAKELVEELCAAELTEYNKSRTKQWTPVQTEDDDIPF